MNYSELFDIFLNTKSLNLSIYEKNQINNISY